MRGGSAEDWEADRESILWIHLIYGHIYSGKKALWHTLIVDRYACVCTHTHTHGLKEKWGYLAVSALLIFSLLYLVFLFIYLSGIYSLAPSYKPLSFCLALQSSHHKKKIYLDEQYAPLGA